MKGIYLCSYRGFLTEACCHMTYNDIKKIKTDLPFIQGDCMTIDLTPYDFIIATPPCNFWSHSNNSYLTSEYALATKHLLPDLIVKLAELGKPFLIENVINFVRYEKYGVLDLIKKYDLNVYEIGRHIYITNIFLNYIPEIAPCCHIKNKSRNQRQGSGGVREVCEAFIESIIDDWFDNDMINLFDKLEKERNQHNEI